MAEKREKGGEWSCFSFSLLFHLALLMGLSRVPLADRGEQRSARFLQTPPIHVRLEESAPPEPPRPQEIEDRQGKGAIHAQLSREAAAGAGPSPATSSSRAGKRRGWPLHVARPLPIPVSPLPSAALPPEVLPGGKGGDGLQAGENAGGASSTDPRVSRAQGISPAPLSSVPAGAASGQGKQGGETTGAAATHEEPLLKGWSSLSPRPGGTARGQGGPGEASGRNEPGAREADGGGGPSQAPGGLAWGQGGQGDGLGGNGTAAGAAGGGGGPSRTTGGTARGLGGEGEGPGRNGLATVEAGGDEVVAVAEPRYRENDRPIYPRIARLKGYEGTALLEVKVGVDGQVKDLMVKKSSGYQILDEAALRAVRKWLYLPARRGGTPVPSRVIVPIPFKLVAE